MVSDLIIMCPFKLYAGVIISLYPLLDRDGYKEMMTPAYSLKGNMLIKSETISSSTTESEGDVYKRQLRNSKFRP